MREAEDVVDEEEHVAALLVAEVLGDGQGAQGDPGAGAGRLVHLPEHQHGKALLEIVRLDHRVLAALLEFRVQVVPFAGALADPANTEKPPRCLATLLINSCNSTVLPTPAPPKRPILPPRR